MEDVECRYRKRLIGWLLVGEDGFLRYYKARSTRLSEQSVIVWKPWGLG